MLTLLISDFITRSLFSLIQFLLQPTNPLIIAVSAGNQTWVLPQCNDSVSEPAGSAASEESAPYCLGESPTGQKMLLNP